MCDEVSVLFSEPKIPQLEGRIKTLRISKSFSALQRAENSSKDSVPYNPDAFTSFSALQRAENSSTPI